MTDVPTVQTAGAYFTQLADVLFGAEVTDRHGAMLSQDAGSDQAVDIIRSVATQRGKVMLIGNGGSAAVAGHVQNDLCALHVRAMVFDQIPFLTAVSNDHGYGAVYERPIQLWGNPGDLLVAISSSGQSDNILRAVQASVAGEHRIMTFSAFRADNSLRQMGELNFYVPTNSYGHAEIAHAVLLHYLTDRVAAARSSDSEPST